MTRSLRALAHVKRVLVLHDLHPDGDNAAWRAGLLASAQGGWLRILHVSRLRSPAAARERLAPLAWRLQEHLQLAVVPQAFRGSTAGELERAAQDADLVVMGAYGHSRLREWVFGGMTRDVLRGSPVCCLMCH